jgi:hypothetical protein
MCLNEYEAAVAAFMRTKGITRCPTACAFPNLRHRRRRGSRYAWSMRQHAKGCASKELPLGPAGLDIWDPDTNARVAICASAGSNAVHNRA